MITAGTAAGRRLPLTDELVIGREVSGEGRLSDDNELSRRHARVAPRGGRPADDRGSRVGERDLRERRARPRPPGAQGGRLGAGWLDDPAGDRCRAATRSAGPGHPAARAGGTPPRPGSPGRGPGGAGLRAPAGLRRRRVPRPGGHRPRRHGRRLPSRGARAPAPGGPQADPPRAFPGRTLPRALSARVDGRGRDRPPERHSRLRCGRRGRRALHHDAPRRGHRPARADRRGGTHRAAAGRSHRPPGRRRARCGPRSRACCTATSSRPTSCSPAGTTCTSAISGSPSVPTRAAG